MNDAKRTLRRLKLRVRRNVKKQKRQVEDITLQADDSINRLVFRRFENLYRVRRFVAAWVLLMFFVGFGSIWQVRGLDKYYLQLAPTDGGVYREGIIGSFTNASPLFAVTNVDVSVTRLVFSGLFSIDPDGSLRPDLARDFTVDDKGLVYTVYLREDIQWHDGVKFDADDVMFTYGTIKNPNVNSPLYSSWRGVDLRKVDQYTVEFTLPNVLSSFKYSLINGIVPNHVLGSVDAGDLRTSTFNTVRPIGTGPFKYSKVEVIGGDPDKRQEKITLAAYDSYHKNRVHIDGIVLRTYRDEDSMIKAFDDQLITSMVGLDSIPDDFPVDDTVKMVSTPLRSSVMVFFNNTRALLNDVKIRQALAQATDSEALRKTIGYDLVAADEPFLKSHFSYDPAKSQAVFNPLAAEQLLEESGWIKGLDGYRYKNNERLQFRIVSQSLAEYATVVHGLQEQWKAVGVYLDAALLPEEEMQSNIIVGHDYDILLYGIAIGPDPDVFAFWHSSQADARLRTRLNLSEYINPEADESLEAGRTRIDEQIRKVKYAPFLDRWRTDVPAVALYQPRFLFVTRGDIVGYKNGQFNSPNDRFYSVQDWQVRREKMVR